MKEALTERFLGYIMIPAQGNHEEIRENFREGARMLYIRTDMNETIATGHVMRCLAIAEAWKGIDRA